jgi:hypothetical protein
MRCWRQRSGEKSNDPETVLKAERYLESIENAMRQTGLFRDDEVRAVNEGKLRARWKLGGLLAKVERGGGRGKVSAGLKHLLKQVALDKQTALEAQRISAMPVAMLDKTLAWWRERESLGTFDDLIRIASYRSNNGSVAAGR